MINAPTSSSLDIRLPINPNPNIKDRDIYAELQKLYIAIHSIQNYVAQDAKSRIGFITKFAGTIIPVGYLQCPTTATLVAISTYPQLFAAISYTWGGSGVSFGLPYFTAIPSEIYCVKYF